VLVVSSSLTDQILLIFSSSLSKNALNKVIFKISHIDKRTIKTSAISLSIKE
jgi:hypothetical protein